MTQPNDLSQVVRFLLGEGDLRGAWFGETLGDVGPYWWRTDLRAAFARLESPTPAEARGEVEGYALSLEARDMHAEAALLRTLARQLAWAEEKAKTAEDFAAQAGKNRIRAEQAEQRVAAVEGLVAKWRNTADKLSPNDPRSYAHAVALRDSADELDAARPRSFE